MYTAHRCPLHHEPSQACETVAEDEDKGDPVKQIIHQHLRVVIWLILWNSTSSLKIYFKNVANYCVEKVIHIDRTLSMLFYSKLEKGKQTL